MQRQPLTSCAVPLFPNALIRETSPCLTPCAYPGDFAMYFNLTHLSGRLAIVSSKHLSTDRHIHDAPPLIKDLSSTALSTGIPSLSSLTHSLESSLFDPSIFGRGLS